LTATTASLGGRIRSAVVRVRGHAGILRTKPTLGTSLHARTPPPVGSTHRTAMLAWGARIHSTRSVPLLAASVSWDPLEKVSHVGFVYSQTEC
jgi:hypothetical protein